MQSTEKTAVDVAPVLVLLTNFFPFHRGEEYLETELPYLCEQFERIVIAPVMYEHGMSQTRHVSANVRVVAVPSPSSPGARLRGTLFNLPAVIKLGLLRNRARTIAPHLLVYDAYFASRGVAYWTAAKPAIMSAVGPERPVVIYSYWLYVTALVGSLIQRDLPGRITKFISRAHRYDVVTSASSLRYLPLRPHLMRSVDCAHPVSEEGHADLIRDVPHEKAKVSIRRLGVDGPARVGLKDHKPLHLVSCSSLKTVKRVPLLVESLRLLSAAQVPFTWMHFGGSDEPLEELRQACVEKLPSDAWQLAGHVTNDEVLAYLAQAKTSLFVNLSESEGVPVSIMEAMAAGVPVLATAAGGTPDIVQDGVNGMLLPIDIDAIGVCAALTDFATQPEAEFIHMCEAARLTWETSWRAADVYSDFAKSLAVAGPEKWN